jgi:hypothetical protein
MSSGEIDRIPVTQLTVRYDIVRSAVYTRLKALSIEPERVGNKSYVNADQLQLLDALHEFIKAGGTTAEFLEQRGIQPNRGGADPEEEFAGQSSGLSRVDPDLMKMVAAIAAQVAAKVQPPLPEPDPFDYLKTLEQAAQNTWLLRTSELAYLLNLRPTEILTYGEHFSEAGFVFTQAGYRSGGELAWKVSKPLR